MKVSKRTLRRGLAALVLTALVTVGLGWVNQSSALAATGFSLDAESNDLTGWSASAGASTATGSKHPGTWGGTYGYNVASSAAAGYLTLDSAALDQDKEYASLAAWVRVNSAANGESVDLITLRHNQSANHFDVFVKDDHASGVGTLCWDLLGVSDFDCWATPFQFGKWVFVQAKVFFGGTTYTADVQINGTYEGQIDTTGQTATTARGFWLGSATAKTHNQDYDNVTLNIGDADPGWVGVFDPAPPTTLTKCPNLVLRGDVNPNGQPTDYRFRWGTTSAMGNNSGWISAGAGYDTVPVEHTIAPGGTTTHTRIEVRGANGVTVNGLTYVPTCGN
jgi:hypothetical protein